ncbi:MAG TPA: phospholipid carrier-dependent glycosyltransferase [Planctomycetota bacterium]|nr:phospholipid carrier-dependent glycosyltransferase [Planctomycetota bacterium]
MSQQAAAIRPIEAPVLDSKDRAGAFAIFALLLALYTLTFSGLPDNPDAEVEFQTVRSLAQEAHFALGSTPEADAILLAQFDVAPGGPGREGRWYSWFGVGQAIVALPFYFAGELAERVFPEVEALHAQTSDYGARRSEYWQHLAVGWRNSLLAAATAALLAIAARRLGASRRSALLSALLFGTATFVWPQARSTLSDVQAMFCLCLAFERWLAYRSTAREAPWTLATAGGALALAVLTRVAIAPAAVVVAAACLGSMVAHRSRTLSWCAFLAPIALGAALFLLTNALRFSSLTQTGYHVALAEGSFFTYPLHLGIAGILISPGKGLLWMAPLVLLVPIGFHRARAGGERAWPWLACLTSLAVAAPILCTQTWHGAWTYGPRYLLPCLPFLWPAVALAFDRARERRLVLGAATLLSLLGFATAIPGVVVDHMTHQDLAVQAARIAWPEPGGSDERERDAARFLSIQWDWRFAAPWAHWRIAALRARGNGDAYSARQLFGVDSNAVVTSQHDRESGWRHFAWVYLRDKLGGPAWILLAWAGSWLVVALAAWRRAQGSR